MQTINFNINWNNKLTNQCFTTLRPRNDDKYKIGEEYEIVLDKMVLTTATILDIRQYVLGNITEFMCRLDSGYSKADTQRMFINGLYKDKNIEWEQQEISYILLHNAKIGFIPIEYSDKNTEIHFSITVPILPGQLELGMNTGSVVTSI